MEHAMKLNSEPFNKIKSGIKTIELRLYDEKRRQISIGDTIVFTNTLDKTAIRVRVKAVHVFKSFCELYDALPLLKCGYTATDINQASPIDMEKYYSKEQQNQFGVVGIEISLL